MASFIEREIKNFTRRFLYSIIISHLIRNIEKYSQWKAFFLSILIVIAINIVAFPFAIGTLPISIIAFVIYWIHRINQLKKIGNTRNSKYWYDSQFWYGLNGWQFEQEVADVFEKNGYNTEVTKGSGDGGVDIIMNKNNVKSIVQCKLYRGHKATPQELRALWGVKDDFNADEVIFVATDGITDMGRDFVSNKPNFRVLTLDDIIELSRNPEKDNPTVQIQTNNTTTESQKLILNVAILLAIAFVILITLYHFGIIHEVNNIN